MKTEPRRRGYLLMEVMIAGAITAVALGGLLTMAGNNLATSTLSARDLTAQGLVQRAVEQVRMKGYLAVTSESATTVSTEAGTYTRTIAVKTGSETIFGGIASNFKDVAVTVTFAPGSAKPHTTTTTVRLYE